MKGWNMTFGHKKENSNYFLGFHLLYLKGRFDNFLSIIVADAGELQGERMTVSGQACMLSLHSCCFFFNF